MRLCHIPAVYTFNCILNETYFTASSILTNAPGYSPAKNTPTLCISNPFEVAATAWPNSCIPNTHMVHNHNITQ